MSNCLVHVPSENTRCFPLFLFSLARPVSAVKLSQDGKKFFSSSHGVCVCVCICMVYVCE